MKKEKKVKKEKLVKKLCMICGDDTDDYIIYKNGAVCKTCQEADMFIKLQNG